MKIKLNDKQKIYFKQLLETTEIQSVLFDINKWDETKAKDWLKNHGYKSSKMDKTENYIRFRQLDPKQFDIIRTSGGPDSSKGQKVLADKGIKFIFGIEK